MKSPMTWMCFCKWFAMPNAHTQCTTCGPQLAWASTLGPAGEQNAPGRADPEASSPESRHGCPPAR